MTAGGISARISSNCQGVKTTKRPRHKSRDGGRAVRLPMAVKKNSQPVLDFKLSFTHVNPMSTME